MGTLEAPSAPGGADCAALKTNMNVDYVIQYDISSDKAEAEAGFIQLIEALTKVGLASEVRQGDGSSVLVFVKVASNQYLTSQIYRERLQDWLYGVRTSALEKDVAKVFENEPVTEAERLRLVYLLITKPKNDGGAGITPKSGQWEMVTSIFPLHDHTFNSAWIKTWSTKYFLDEEDLDRIRDKFGESVAFYFAFLQSYFAFQVFPAAFGFAVWLILGRYSWLYAFVNSLWSVVFFEWWKKKEVDLAVQWGVHNVSRIQHPRAKYQWDYETPDPVTGELVKHYPPMKRLKTQLLQIPFAIACVLVLGALYIFCFGIEIFLTQVYDGPFKSYLTFTPTIIMSSLLPVLSTILTKVAEILTERENYQTNDAHLSAFVSKIFVINFITSYSPLFLSAFVYMPFGNLMTPYLHIFTTAARRFCSEKSVTTQEFHINPDRLKGQMVYFAVTAQVVNIAVEFVVPYVKRIAFKKVERVQARLASQDDDLIKDVPEEHKFLQRVRDEAKLEVYDVAVDYREMVVQFGYLSLFSSIWPLTPLSFLINNWIELRSDAMKIAMSSQRPIPWRSDSIGPWLDSLGFLSWAGSLVSSAIVFLFSGEDEGPGGDPSKVNVVGLLVTVLCAEHLYLALQFAVRYALRQIDSPGLQKERKQRFAMRKHHIEETLGPDAMEAAVPPTSRTGEKITLVALEEEARRLSTTGGTPEQTFWLRQQGMEETIHIGRKLISQAKPHGNWESTMQATIETVEEADSRDGSRATSEPAA
ncbi:putative plasma membrane channel protein [Rosellinia necatrix]|uniref:Putative plasma membrane channel protein n=1 Tax=Rosellinia necatrix TaxID=77044 RepID=A0A1W2TGM9_ROSNE|nr:putative plasma membrane channel protein [Rosellinia necatrix]